MSKDTVMGHEVGGKPRYYPKTYSIEGAAAFISQQEIAHLQVSRDIPEG